MKCVARWVGLSSVLAAAIFTSKSALAQAGEGMGSYANPVSAGFFGGASIPLGDLADFATTGWHAGGLVQWNSPTAPFGFRADVAYHSFGIDDQFSDEYAENMIVGTLNGVWMFPSTSTVRPYVLGGAGLYRESCDICSSQTKFGINGGLGILVPLSGISTIIEARFHMVFDSEDATTPGTTSVSNSIFVPISVGILFR